MSDNIPLDIQVQIIKRLPVKSLLQFRSVSKTWNCLIDSPHFISSYSTQVQHLLVSSYHPFSHSENKYDLIVDDDTFPQHKVSVPLPDNMVEYYKICGCSHGLLCFYGDFRQARGGHISPTKMAVLWNPSIRKAVAVVVPHVESERYESILGFGVCRATMDPKIVKIRYISNLSKDINSISCIPWQVEVFTLSTGVWRSSNSNLPRKSIQFNMLQEVLEVDGFLYWLATDRIRVDGGFKCYYLIVSFDLISREFREINLPDSLAYQDDSIEFSMHKLRGSLVIVHEWCVFTEDQVSTVFRMEDGVPKSFTKLFTLDITDLFIREFRKSGEPLIEVEDKEHDHALLAVYDPHSEEVDDLGIDGTGCEFLVFPYIETLLLLDHPKFIVYNDI